jgi:AcrR family transcriptional regulator
VTERGSTTRARLIEATTRVVADLGYAHATTRAIAQEAGVAEGTIYRHFPDKASLFYAAVLERNAAMVEDISDLAGRAGAATVEANLVALLSRLASLRDEVLPLELAILTDPEHATRRQEMASSLRSGRLIGPPKVVADYLEAEQTLGRIRSDLPAAEVAGVLLATLFGLGIVATKGVEGVDHRLLASAVRLIAAGLEPRSEE